MKDLVIIGNGSFARQMSYYITEYDSRQVAAFSVDGAYIRSDASVLDGGATVVPLETVEEEFPPDRFEVLLGIGYSKMNQVRRELFLRCKEKGYTVASFIHPTAMVSKGVKLGEGNIILECGVIQPFVTLGDGNLLWHGVEIAHDNTLGSFNTICQNTSIAGASRVGDYCFFGNSSIVFGGIRIADYTLVAAGAILKGDTKPYDVVVPAKSVFLEGRKSRDYI